MFNRRAHFATFRLVTALNVSLECLLLYLSPSVEKAARNVNKRKRTKFQQQIPLRSVISFE